MCFERANITNKKVKMLLLVIYIHIVETYLQRGDGYSLTISYSSPNHSLSVFSTLRFIAGVILFLTFL